MVISKFKVSLVRFDTKFPVGVKNEEFVKLYKNIKPNSDLLIAEVGVEDFDPYKNLDLSKRFGVTKDMFPVLKLFVDGNTDKPINFTNDYNFPEILTFIKKNSDIVLELKDCLPEFDTIVKKSLQKNISKDEQKKHVNELKNKVKALSDENEKNSAQVYVKLMDKVIERGVVFINSEEQRVSNLLSGKLTVKKLKELETRLNIIQSFKGL